MKLLDKLKEKLSQPVGELGNSSKSDNRENHAKNQEENQAENQIVKPTMISIKRENNGKQKFGNWRKVLPANVNSELNTVVSQTHPYRHAYKKALRVRDAQQWVAIAQLSERIKRLEAELRTKA